MNETGKGKQYHTTLARKLKFKIKPHHEQSHEEQNHINID